LYLIEVIQLFCSPVAIRIFENAVQATNAGKTQVADRQTGNLRRHVSMMLAADLFDVIYSVDSADHLLHCEQGSKSEVKTPRLGRLRLGQISTAEARLG
jgi:hypothetical protein